MNRVRLDGQMEVENFLNLTIISLVSGVPLNLLFLVWGSNRVSKGVTMNEQMYPTR